MSSIVDVGGICDIFAATTGAVIIMSIVCVVLFGCMGFVVGLDGVAGVIGVCRFY